MKALSVLAGCSAVLLAAACSGTSPNSDAGGADAGADGGADAGGFLSDGGLASYCDAVGNGGCLSPYACLSLGGNTGGFCSAGCGVDGGACPGGGACAQVGTATFCTESCTDSSTCLAGDVCETLSASTSLCIPDCRTHADMCGGTVACNPNLGFCTAVGPQTFGQPCQGNDAGACEVGLVCAVVTATAAQGFCTQACTPDGGVACPATPTGASCDIDTQSSTTSFCGWPCSGPTDMGCPAGLSCQATSTGAYLCQ
jgi:hypothetical protein